MSTRFLFPVLGVLGLHSLDFRHISTLISFEQSSTSFPYIPRSGLGRGLVAEILVSFLSYRFVFLETFSVVDP